MQYLKTQNIMSLVTYCDNKFLSMVDVQFTRTDYHCVKLRLLQS